MPRPRFTLRVVLAVMTIVAVVAWQAGIVKQRRAALDRLEVVNFPPPAQYMEGFHGRWLISIRRYFGDRPFAIIYTPNEATTAEIDRMKSLFPEADIKPLSSRDAAIP